MRTALVCGGRAPDGIVAESEDAEVDRGVIGYRIVRMLGRGERSVVYLGRPADKARGTTAPQSVALKIIANHVTDENLALEILACESVVGATPGSDGSTHVVRLLDVASAHGVQRCLVFERLDGGTLTTLLRTRQRIRPGEAATIMISIFRAVRDLHRSGWAHNALSASTVLFDRSGRPVLIALGHVSVLPTKPSRSGVHHEIPAEDWRRLRTVCTSVLDHTDSDARPAETLALRRALDHLVDDPTPHAHHEFENAAFAFAQPSPVVLARDSTPRPDGFLDVLGTDARARSAPARSTPRLQTRSAVTDVARPSAEAFRARLTALFETGVRAGLVGRLRDRFLRHKRPTLTALAVAGVIALAGLAALPPAGAAHPDPGRSSAAVPTASTKSTPTPTPTLMPNATGASPAEGDPGNSAPGDSAPGDGAPREDDPVEAAALLLAIRARCLMSAKPGCLDHVDPQGSALADEDRAGHPTGLPTDSARIVLDRFTSEKFSLSLIERAGDSALIEITPRGHGATTAQTKPASILLIKGEAGWRLRALFDD